MSKIKKDFTSLVMMLCAAMGVLLVLVPQSAAEDPFSFAVTADMRGFSGTGIYDRPRYFRGVCEAIAAVGPGAFMVSPGDIDPPASVKWTIEQHIDSAYTWYPVVGNHDLPGGGFEGHRGSNMDWLRNDNAGGNSLPGVVKVGPTGCQETTYSFDYQNAHFVVLNEYYDGSSDTGTDGDVVDSLYYWLVEDLAANTKQHVFVFGHEPAFPQPDADNGRKRHIGDSLDKYPAHRDRFWNLLRDQGVVAYICGHSHNYSAVKIDGVWQWDAGHARGKGDTGTPSTFFIIHVDADHVMLNVYRDVHDGVYDYDDIVHSQGAFLPVKLSSFTARREKSAVVLEWKTKSEVTNRGFILQRRQKEAYDWKEIASYLTHINLMEQNADSLGAGYKYVDPAVQPDCIYEYRLAVVSRDGQKEYLGTVEIEREINDDIITDH